MYFNPFLVHLLAKERMKDAQGFIRDPEALSTALEVLTYREKTVRMLISALEQIN